MIDEESLNKFNLGARVYKENYIENLKKEYLKVEEEYNNKVREYREVLLINFV